MRDLIRQIATDVGLTEAERAQRIPSGSETVIASRVHWAKTFLKQAGLVEQPKRAMVQITPRGTALLAKNPEKIDSPLLLQFDEFRSFLARTKTGEVSIQMPLPTAETAGAPELVVSAKTPEEQIAAASRALDDALRDALLTRILEGSPAFFEKMILDLLLKMGYGGSRTDAGQQLGGTGDGGVDGIINEDQLGLDRVYLQAKRYKPGNTIGSETVQAFIGALVGRGAHKGVLITTSSFSKAAVSAASRSGALRLVLIDGNELTELLTRFNIGVRVAQSVEIKRVDLDYFEDAEAE